MKKNFAVLMFIFSCTGIALVTVVLSLGEIAQQQISKPGCNINRIFGAFEAYDTIADAPGCYTPGGSNSIFDSTYIDFQVAYQYIFIVCLVASFLPELICAAVGFYNMCSKPYQTFADTTAIIIYFSTAGGLLLLSIIFYVVLFCVEYPGSLPQETQENGTTITVQNKYVIESTSFMMSFWLLCGACAINGFGIVVALLARRDAARCQEDKDFIEGPKGGLNNDVFSL